MNSDPNKTEVDSGNQITGATELSDAELSQVTGGDSVMGIIVRGAAQLPGGSGVGKMLSNASTAGTAAGAAGASTTDPKPD